MNPSLSIPDAAVPAAFLLVGLAPKDFSDLLVGFQKAKRCSSRAELARSLRASTPGIKIRVLRPIVDLVVSLYSLKDDGAVPTNLILQALFAGIDDHESFQDELEPDELETLKSRLASLLEIGGSLNFISKAADVTNDHDKSFSDVRILTDLRPLFEDSLETGPVGFSLMHTLKLVFQEDFETKEFFVVLNPAELEALKKCVDRAQLKEKSLRDVLAKYELELIQ